MLKTMGMIMRAAEGDTSGGGGGFNSEHLFGGDVVKVEAVVADKAAEAAAKAAEAATAAAGETGEGAFLKWMKDAYPEAPEGVVKVDNWKTQRDLNARMAKDFGNTSMELAQAKRDLAEAKKAGGSTLPEVEAVKKLTGELEALRVKHESELGEWTAHKAKQELEGVDAFRREFDGKRVAVMEGAREVATEAGVPEETLGKVFAATTELALVKALNEIEDPDAKALIADKARSFLALTKQRDATTGKDPVGALKQWKDYEESVKGATAKGFSANLSNKMLSAMPAVQEMLKEDPFMSTAAGQATMSRLSAMFTSGHIPDEKTLVHALAKAESAEVYRSGMAKAIQDKVTVEKRVIELEKQLGKYEKIDPGQSGGAAAGGKAGGGFDAAGRFFGA